MEKVIGYACCLCRMEATTLHFASRILAVTLFFPIHFPHFCIISRNAKEIWDNATNSGVRDVIMLQIAHNCVVHEQ